MKSMYMIATLWVFFVIIFLIFLRLHIDYVKECDIEYVEVYNVSERSLDNFFSYKSNKYDVYYRGEVSGNFTIDIPKGKEEYYISYLKKELLLGRLCYNSTPQLSRNTTYNYLFVYKLAKTLNSR